MATATTCCSMQRTAKSSRSSSSSSRSSSIEDLNSVYGRCLAKSLIKLCDDDCSRSTTPEIEKERVRRREREKRRWRWRRSKVAPAEVIRLSGCGCGCGSLPNCKMAVLPAASAAPAAAAGALSSQPPQLSVLHFLTGYCDGSCTGCLAGTWKTH